LADPTLRSKAILFPGIDLAHGIEAMRTFINAPLLPKGFAVQGWGSSATLSPGLRHCGAVRGFVPTSKKFLSGSLPL
jgi:hypothetical protein